MPRHEIGSVVTEVGTKVTKFKIGDRVGIGCMIGSCDNCANCGDNLENYFLEMVPIHGGKFSPNNDREDFNGTINYGCFSDIMVHFVFKFPNNMRLNGGAPLFCAGITVYSPLRYYGLDKPKVHIGMVGLDGLGHMAVKFAKAMGLRVTVINTSPSKKEEAINHLGANAFLVSHDAEQMQECYVPASYFLTCT
ncbi:LOW QUALITY PROTEIN: hypothetical protein EUGRSUZ_H02411 [Eucalyptus grandis]|uniref:Uncharacterized protein n=1 Tax=Eucalyptus grandis TaxID=71139 RepID=A0ACC3JRF9_EUCGR|nr:LOW QUALITY PROTEIN: hypothetical protein EUGRSUZ_H02411 [Eucalyptus grandis]